MPLTLGHGINMFFVWTISIHFTHQGCHLQISWGEKPSEVLKDHACKVTYQDPFNYLAMMQGYTYIHMHALTHTHTVTDYLIFIIWQQSISFPV